jgi:hypothetical protein
MDGFVALFHWYPNVRWEIDPGLTGCKYGYVRGHVCYVSPAQASLLYNVESLDDLAFLLAHLPFRNEDAQADYPD